MWNLLFIWKLFEWVSGLKINKDKSELFYFGSNPRTGDKLSHIIGCKSGILPFRYLGLPLYNKRLCKDDWALVINHIESRIDGWKTKLLSQGGQLTLVNSVLTNLPLFYLSIFRPPQWVLHRIEALRRAFFWKGCSKISRGACLVNWKSIYSSKIQRGMGILNMDSINMALLTKWWWRFFNEP